MLGGMGNSMFTYHLLQALRGEGRILGMATCASSTFFAMWRITSLSEPDTAAHLIAPVIVEAVAQALTGTGCSERQRRS